MSRPGWNVYFMMMAKLAATRSTCNSRPNGAVLVLGRRMIATGYNGAIGDMPHCSDEGGTYCFRREQGAKDGQKDRICRAAHAEANALAMAARYGIATNSAVCYTTLSPCPVCMKLLHQAGVQHIFYETLYDDESPVCPPYLKIFEQVTIEPDMLSQILTNLARPSTRRMVKTR